VSWLQRVAEVNEQDWRPVGTPACVAATIGIAFVAFLANTGQRWVFLLDNANLALHEAGHPIFGLLLGDRITVYGGTFAQLLFPIAAGVTFWRRREALSFALCTVWLFENFWNIARYMADARAQVLPLVGSGEHDWTEIFSRWSVLDRDTGIAAFVILLGWLGVLIAWGWLARRWWLDRERGPH
jgi:hypothetical protein